MDYVCIYGKAQCNVPLFLPFPLIRWNLNDSFSVSSPSLFLSLFWWAETYMFSYFLLLSAWKLCQDAHYFLTFILRNIFWNSLYIFTYSSYTVFVMMHHRLLCVLIVYYTTLIDIYYLIILQSLLEPTQVSQ